MTTPVVVLVVLALARPGGSSDGSDDGIQHAGTPYEGASHASVPSPEFALRDQDGEPVSIRRFRGNAYAIKPQGEGFEHSAVVLVLGAQGRQRVSFPVDKLTSDGLAHDVRVVGRRDAATAR